VKSLNELVLSASAKLLDNGVAEPARESRSLMEFAIKQPPSFLRAHPEYILTQSELNRFDDAIDRRSKREPFQHIVGKQQFYGLDFTVTSDVLVPRPETELLVEHAIELLRTSPNPRILEIGTGSGCIATALLKNLKSATVLATDLSASAIETAKINSKRHSVENRIEFVESDIFDSLSNTEQFDLIVSNPPYIPFADIEGLQPEVREYDPMIALTDGLDGLGILRRIVIGAPAFLNPNGYLLVEFGIAQSGDVKTMFLDHIWQSLEVINDLQSIPRLAIAHIGPDMFNKG
jgi:release factor glutamine methyltransferase